MKKLGKTAVALACLALLTVLISRLPGLWGNDREHMAGLREKERTLLRIWVIDAPGGAQSWLTRCLRDFERSYPGIATFVRQVAAADLADADAVLPDVVLYMPGTVAEPERFFLPMSGEAVDGGAAREDMLRCGRYRGAQYGLPLCWGAWVLAIDGTITPDAVQTPSPTTLLGRPAITQAAEASPTPGYPLPAASKADCALQSPGGTALFTLGTLLPPSDRPPLPERFGQDGSPAVYEGFRRGAWATAMLTTGQATALSGLVSAGNRGAFRVMTADAVVTDQVWLGSVTEGAAEAAGLLLAHLTGADCQRKLADQGLFTVRNDLALYASGTAAEVERAARQAFGAINAYIGMDAVNQAAWRFWQGQITLDEALLPLL